ncbi:dienelactone hydrolase [Apiospora hydei]|uniref:Dienelactone hydrolase n=1 Tax=Apiospora hydei TaxID=1337664 RepID=A0ABR1X385_9PEZI
MSEPELATKAPESDVNETIIPGDTPAQTGPTMGEHCTTDRPTPSGEAPRGEIRKLGEVDAYISKPASYPTSPAKLLLLLTGGTGLQSANNQIQSDKFADEGFVVVMPDLFGGDPAPNSAALPEAEASTSFLDNFKLKAVETAKSFMIDMWLARHTEEKSCRFSKRSLRLASPSSRMPWPPATASTPWATASAPATCCSWRPSARLRRRAGPARKKPADEEAGEGAGLHKKGPFIKAGALAHATLVSPSDFEGLKQPISLVCVESDPMFPDDVRTQGEDMMSKAGLEHEVQVYPGVPHGFAVIGDYEDTHIKDAQATAHEQMLKWLKEH